MLIHTIELDRRHEVPEGYGVMDWDGLGGTMCKKTNSFTVLQYVMDFTKDKNITVYSHQTRQEFERYPIWRSKDCHFRTWKTLKEYPFINYGDKVMYLDIYYQENLPQVRRDTLYCYGK